MPATDGAGQLPAGHRGAGVAAPGGSPRAGAAPGPVKELAGLATQESIFAAASATKPLVIASEKAASEHFSKDDVARMLKEVDFSKQVVLVFAWHGSGQDRMSFTVAESAPEQVAFTLTRGRTRDLRQHVKIYALRSDVKWSVR